TGGDRTREVSQFQAKDRHYFAIVKLIQVIEGERAALWFRCSGNPNRQLFRFELLDLFRRPWRNFGRLVPSVLWLHTAANYINATPPRLASKPLAIRRRRSSRGKNCSCSHSAL